MIVGMSVVLIGAVMSVLDFKPYSDYMLCAGAVLVFLRGALKRREE